MMLAKDGSTLTAVDAEQSEGAAGVTAGERPYRDENDSSGAVSSRRSDAHAGENRSVTGEPDPTGAVIPDRTDYTFSRRLVCLSAPDSAAAASYRSLQTHLSARHLRDGRRGLALIAPDSEAGCTTVAANLAIASAQAGISTLLIDANLGRPEVHHFILPNGSTAGLAQMLSNTGNDQEDAICRNVRPKLSVLFAGDSAFNAQELVAGPKFKEVISHCVRSFDFTIIDSPCVSAGPGARQVAASVRYALLIARKDVTSLRCAQRSGAELAADRVKLVGSFLTEFG
ncbi:CpsD/CapB family tyrosine-protein kinase [Sphingomonas dokdonensis]|uniref:Tyrosine-protein kinase YwqD n=1 Tax=Sphingomonas dokdonensis TaxID=344880 RepID=A0A245ZI68_9SPHN|nr:CpsD/CapB family tyrosine-protein kinase [Sphingomonas dokdonensis]OWK29428.1 tyrosine-protein kinase YwqD [Sphingomonas dokdonensis]